MNIQERLQMKKRKLRQKRVLSLLVGILLLSLITHSILQSASTETIPLHRDPNYRDIEISTLSEKGIKIEFPVFHINEIDQIVESYIQQRLSSFHIDEESQIIMSYNIPHYSKQTVSILFTETQKGTSITNTLNIDLKERRVLSLEDLVDEKKLGEFVNILSNIAFDKWQSSNQLLFAEKETFEDFTLYNDSILFTIKEDGQQDVQLAISKQVFHHLLKEPFQSGEDNKDLVKDREPGDVIMKLPEKGIEDLLNQKVIALTFDDGPKQGTTDAILDILKKYNAHATFFVLGSMIEKNPDLLRRMNEEGQEIGNHTYSHKQMTKLTDEEISTEVKQTQNLIQDITGKTPKLIRPPYGAINERVRKVLANQMEVMLWNLDTEDWKCRNTNQIVQEVMNSAGDGKVILMHDLYQTSVDAVAIIVEKLSLQGYKIVSASELVEIQKRRMLMNGEK